MALKAVIPKACALMCVVFLLGGCEFFGGTDVFDVDVPASFTVPLPLTLPDQATIDASPDSDGDGFREVAIPPLYQVIDLVALVPELGQHAGSVKAVRVEVIRHLVTANTLDVVLPPIDIRVGRTDGTYDEATTLALTQEVPDLSTADFRASITEVGRANGSALMSSLTFSIGAGTTILVPLDYQRSTDAAATTELLFEVTVVANAAE